MFLVAIGEIGLQVSRDPIDKQDKLIPRSSFYDLGQLVTDKMSVLGLAVMLVSLRRISCACKSPNACGFG